MANYIQGIFTPKNPDKYLGANVDNIQYRSGWEAMAFKIFDEHPNVLGWASECIKIPYYNPFTKKSTVYIPDLFVVYVDKNGKKHVEIIEIKPLKETGMGKTLEETKSKRDKAFIILNRCKWAAAQSYCQKNGYTFRVMTEADLFHTGNRFASKPAKPKVPKKRTVRK